MIKSFIPDYSFSLLFILLQVRQDVRVARMTQEEIEQDAALRELERKKMRETEDARIAAEMHRLVCCHDKTSD